MKRIYHIRMNVHKESIFMAVVASKNPKLISGKTIPDESRLSHNMLISEKIM